VYDAELAPDPSLMESMRAVGYTLETAIADIVDNSITASADTVEIRFGAAPEPYVAITDNGAGMDLDGLFEAMRLAGKGPAHRRDPHDLGRFGLGLKTASLSQARTLTVASRKAGKLAAVRWSIDHLVHTERWALQVLDDHEIDGLPHVDELRAGASGTVVIWNDLDQLHAPAGHVERVFDEGMLHVRDHLSLVFHRFTGGVVAPLRRRLTLRINGSAVPSVDPFLSTHRGTREGIPEIIAVEDAVVRVQPYTLPYISRMSEVDKRTAQISGLLRDSQGFYIYRAERLVLWGTWFRIMPKNELGKLARVRVDIPNSLDHLWSLDIKKSAASPPSVVRTQLKRLAGKIVRPSRTVHEYRGRRQEPPDRIERMWNLVDERGEFRYELNRDHPLLATLAEMVDSTTATQVSHVLRAIESGFPVADAYNRMSNDETHRPPTVDRDDLADLARTFHRSLGGTPATLASRLALVEPFDSIDDLESFLRKVIDE
jgi:hypothetical protein